MQIQLEELISSKKDDLQKVEAKFEKEKERSQGLEKQFKKTLRDKDLIEEKLQAFSE